jgi:uncharacterized protein
MPWGRGSTEVVGQRIRIMDLVKRFLLLLIRGYRQLLSPLLPPSCRFQPTCSAYALEAVTQHGVALGSWLAVKRILRCHPWNSGGYDPVPEAKIGDRQKGSE